MIRQFLSPALLVIGGGSVARLPEVLAATGVCRPLLVVDPRLLSMGLADRVLEAMRGCTTHSAVYAGVVQDPADTSVMEAAALLRDGHHDGVIGLGGGSALDTAKAAALAASCAEPLRAMKVPRTMDLRTLPVVAIPTTAGTGSEVTRAAVVTDTTGHEKMLLVGSGLMPAAAIVDYELTLTCPPRVTADTGLDALTHAIESFVSLQHHPHGDAYALSALKLIGPNLETVFHDPGNRPAREAMALGAMHAGFAIGVGGTALVHGMGRPLGAFFHVPHGLSNAMLLEVVTAYSADAAADRYRQVALALGWATEADNTALAVERLLHRLRALNASLQVPRLSEWGIDAHRFEELLPTMAQQALQSGTPQKNPRVPEAEAVVALYRQAWAA